MRFSNLSLDVILKLSVLLFFFLKIELYLTQGLQVRDPRAACGPPEMFVRSTYANFLTFLFLFH